MIGTIRRHQQWLWYVIIAAIIVSFVWYFQPSRRFGGGGGGSDMPATDLGSVFGQPITPQQLTAAEREGRLFFRLRFNEWPDSEDQKKEVEKWAQQRLVLDAELKLHKIDVTDQAAARFTKQLMGVRPYDNLPMDKFNDFVQNELGRKGGLSFDDFDHFVRHQAGQEYLISLFGMSGKLITDKEAAFFYHRENEPMSVQTVSFNASDFYAQTAPTDDELKDYFDKHQADYRLPDRVQVNYIQFDASNYLAKADQQLTTNLEARVDEVYHTQGPDAFKDKDGKPLTQEAAETLIKKEVRLVQAVTEARRDADAFMNELFDGHDNDHPFSVYDLEKLAQTKGMTVKTTPPFDAKNGTPELNIPPAQLQLLFSLQLSDPDDKENSTLYAPSPLRGTNAVYVCGLAKQFPSQLRTLDEVRDQVVKDYRQEKSVELAKEAGDRFLSAVQVGLMQGKTFAAICASQYVRPKTLPPFSLVTTSIPDIQDKAEFEQLQSASFNVPTGQCSKLLPTADGGMAAYVQARLPVDEAAMQKELPAYLDKMREQRQVAAFEEWFGRQMQLHFVPPASERANPVG
jgi:hypothetical protein